MNEHTFNVHWRGRTWIVWPDAMKIDTLEKTTTEKRTYEFEFAVQDEIRAGDTIASVSTPAAALRSGSAHFACVRGLATVRAPVPAHGCRSQ